MILPPILVNEITGGLEIITESACIGLMPANNERATTPSATSFLIFVNLSYNPLGKLDLPLSLS